MLKNDDRSFSAIEANFRNFFTNQLISIDHLEKWNKPEESEKFFYFLFESLRLIAQNLNIIKSILERVKLYSLPTWGLELLKLSILVLCSV